MYDGDRSDAGEWHVEPPIARACILPPTEEGEKSWDLWLEHRVPSRLDTDCLMEIS